MTGARLIDLNALSLEELWSTLVEGPALECIEQRAFDEDLASLGGESVDVTTSIVVPPGMPARAAVVPREDGVVAGLPFVARILARRAPSLACCLRIADGEQCREGEPILELAGPLAAMLPLERVILNVLGRMCGVATATRRYVDALEGTATRLCCTRKTLPGWRTLDKYAVRCGGGWLHRIGLDDAMLIKDNHLGAVAPGGLTLAIERAARQARSERPLRFIEVEVDTLEQFDQILAVEPGLVDMVLLDNFSIESLVEAVRRRRAATGSQLVLEASGGVRLDRVRAIAETGVERISCGAITHSVAALDLGLDLATDWTGDGASRSGRTGR